MDEQPQPAHAAPAPRWRPIAAIDRRVLGVLVEKAKTTPDGYPMSINALRSGANQKNNRFPVVELEPEDIEESLGRLRGLGAVVEVQGGGRIARYRHQMYEWLGVDKVELGVMAELLLRGAQTEGELRGRAARMDPIADLAALRPILDSLAAKKLIVSLTPAGRGHVLTHSLYEPRELEKLRAEFGAGGGDRPAPPAAAPPVQPGTRAMPAGNTPAVVSAERAAPSVPRPAPTVGDDQLASRVTLVREEVGALRDELEALREQMERLRRDFDDLVAQLR